MTRLDDGVTPPHYQRRIGTRYPIHVGLELDPLQPTRWPRKKKASTTRTENVSVTGIGFEATTCPDLHRGSAVKIKIGDTECRAAVRVARPGRTPGHSYYGVEVRDQHMKDTMQRLISNYKMLHDIDRRQPTPPPVVRSADRGPVDRLY